MFVSRTFTNQNALKKASRQRSSHTNREAPHSVYVYYKALNVDRCLFFSCVFAGMRTQSGVIRVHIRVAVALRMLAGASYLDIALLFGISVPTVFTILWEVIDAINSTPTVGGFFFPQTEEACAVAAGRWKVCAAVHGAFSECRYT